MPLIKWNAVIEKFVIKSDDATPNDPKKIETPWLLVVPGMRDYTHLRIQAEGSWTQTGDKIGDCGPDGLAKTDVQVGPLQVKDCGAGALVGKLGGSSASLAMPPSNAGAAAAPPAGSLVEGTAFAIGSHCIVTLPTGFIGPLYVGFNGLARPILVKSLKLVVEGAGA
jgi:hypothetical protein